MAFTNNTKENASRATEICETGTIEQPYSNFSKRTKGWIAGLSSFAAMFSGLSSFIYYPVISPLANALHISVEMVNLTITTYQIVSGVAPSLIGDMAYQSGRRPVYIGAFGIYTSANIGLALQSSYPGLLILRMVQSAGSSGTFCRYAVFSPP